MALCPCLGIGFYLFTRMSPPTNIHVFIPKMKTHTEATYKKYWITSHASWKKVLHWHAKSVILRTRVIGNRNGSRPTTIEAIQYWPICSDVTTLQQFIGLASYVTQFEKTDLTAQFAQIELLVPLEYAFNCASIGATDAAIGCSVAKL